MTYFFNLVWTLFNIVFRAYLLSVFWVWFVMTQFTTLPALSVIACIGLSLFISALRPPKSLTAKDIAEAQENNKAELSKYMGLINNAVFTFAYLVLWGCGALVHYLFM